MMNEQPSRSREPKTNINWDACILCQKLSSSKLQCPADTKRKDVGQGYRTFTEILQQFIEIDALPISIPHLNEMDDGSGLESTLSNRKAKWHKDCRLLFTKTQLNRAYERGIKRRCSDDRKGSYRKLTRQTMNTPKEKKSFCFFCDEPGILTVDLHQVMTEDVDQKMNNYIHLLSDEKLLAKLGTGDLIAQDAVYHKPCMVKFTRRAEKHLTRDENQSSDEMLLKNLSQHIDEKLSSKDFEMIKLSDICKMYTGRLPEYGIQSETKVHSTRLKERLLSMNPDISAHTLGRDTVFALREHVGPALRNASAAHGDDDAILSRAASILRNKILEHSVTFEGSFPDECQENSTPDCLKYFIQQLVSGPTTAKEDQPNQATLSISQMVVHNCTVRKRKGVSRQYHTTKREPPLPVYVGLVVHAKTRKRDLVDVLYNLGLSISYDRVLIISSQLAQKACSQYEQDGAVCPISLRKGLFTTSAVDNIDHNPSSTTSRSSFHGTGISLFQHPNNDTDGESRVYSSSTEASDMKSKTVPSLPDYYSVVPAVVLDVKSPPIPEANGGVQGQGDVSVATQEQKRWLDLVASEAFNDNREVGVWLSWGAYHAKLKPVDDDVSPPCLTSLLPLFPEVSKSVSVMKHTIDVVQKAVCLLNPDQTPVICMDQPLYATMKEIQWNWPERYGEKHLVVMFGPLHIEMGLLRLLGEWLEESGWTNVLVQANIASAGIADSYLKASHVGRTRRAHQVTVCSLHILLKQAYRIYTESVNNDEQLSEDDWCDKRCKESPHFLYWYLTTKLQLLVLTFVSSVRRGDFHLYVNSLTRLIPWFFAMNHTNYARWLPVHVRDMVSLNVVHPEVYHEFTQGNFVVRKSSRPFSAIGIDQAHEQANALVKGDGGAIGLTEDPNALRRWMLAGPEISRIIKDFEMGLDQERGIDDIMHHEQTKANQDNFAKDVRSLAAIVEEMGNPFLEESSDLLVLDTRDIVDGSVVDTIRKIENLGKEQHDAYVQDRLVSRKVPIQEPIKRNKISLFRCPEKRVTSKQKLQVSALKSDCSLFSRLFITCQVRGGNLDEFFEHENQPYPPSLSDFGELHFGTKSDLLDCFSYEESLSSFEPNAVIIDGAALVHKLVPDPTKHKTFENYAEQIFVPYIENMLHKDHCKRLDVVWDTYSSNSLKRAARIKRGKGTRRRVAPENGIPRNWENFLRESKNKEELFYYLSSALVKATNIPAGKKIVSTRGDSVITNMGNECPQLSPCTQEEADSRMILHAADCAREGHKRLLIKTVDTDVVVLAVAFYQQLHLEEFWVEISVHRRKRYFGAHVINDKLGEEKAKSLPGFHAFSGCDCTSSFVGRGKKTAWEVWNSYPEVTTAFQTLCTTVDEIPDESFTLLQRFVILMYDRACSESDVNDARRLLFAQKGRAMNAIPPTKGALKQHTKRAIYQAGYIWGQSLIPSPAQPSPHSWGWMNSSGGTWKPFWTDMTHAALGVQSIVKCGCKKGCGGRCKCKKAELPCTSLCACNSDCSS